MAQGPCLPRKQKPWLTFLFGGVQFLLVGIQATFGGNPPPNTGTGLLILGQHSKNRDDQEYANEY